GTPRRRGAFPVAPSTRRGDGVTTAIDRSLSIREAARRWRKAPKWVRQMVRTGRLQAVDLGSLGRPCLRITPEAIKEFEHRMAPVAPAPKRRKQPAGISPSVAALLAEEGGSR